MRMINKEEIALVVDCDNKLTEALKAIQGAKKSLDSLGKKSLEEVGATDLKLTIDNLVSQIGLAKAKTRRLL